MNDLRFLVLTELCKEITENTNGIKLTFTILGEKTDWEDLRYCQFEFIHAKWSKDMGPFPSFGCYPFSDVSDAILDFRSGRVARWVFETSAAYDLYARVKSRGGIPLVRLANAVPSMPKIKSMDLVFIATHMTGGEVELGEEAIFDGHFFSFKVEPGSKYSEDALGLYLPKSGSGFYQKWSESEDFIFRVSAKNKTDIVEQARLGVAEILAAEHPEGSLASSSVLKKAWGL